MGRIGIILGWVARTISGYVKNDPGGGAIIQSELYNDSGVDAPPMNGDAVISVSTQSKGRTAAVGSIDGKNKSTAKPGERRTYARDEGGAIVVTHYLKQDSTSQLENAKGSITLAPDGSTTAKNEKGSSTLAADGSSTLKNAKGSVTLMANGDVIATNGVSLFSLIGAAVTLTDGVANLSIASGAASLLAPAGVNINGVQIAEAGTIVTAAGKNVDTHTHKYKPGSGAEIETPPPT